MSKPVRDSPPVRPALSRDRVLRSALAVADAGGIASLTIRSLAEHLGVKPMSVYHYVANKDEILDGIVDLVFGEIELPAAGGDWRSEMRRRADSARQALQTPPLGDRSHGVADRPGPGHAATPRRGHRRPARGGFSVAMTAHAYALIDSYIYGFALQEASLPFNGPETVGDVAEPMLRQFPTGEYPHFVEMATEYVLQPGYDFGDEFDFGLTVILDALAKLIPDNSRAPTA